MTTNPYGTKVAEVEGFHVWIPNGPTPSYYLRFPHSMAVAGFVGVTGPKPYSSFIRDDLVTPEVRVALENFCYAHNNLRS